MKKCAWLAALFVLITFYCTTNNATKALPAAIFPLTVTTTGPDSVLLEWKIRPGYFLYKNKIKIVTETPDIIHIGQISLPKPVLKTFNQAEAYPVYRGNLQLAIPILALKTGVSVLTIHYQGCADDGFCYPPQDHSVKININQALAIDNIHSEDPENVKDSPPSSFFHEGNLLLTLVTFLGLGLLLAFTPCILPMIPVLSGIIVGHSASITVKKAFLLSLSYVLAMAFTYAIMGIIVAKIGSNLQIIFQAPSFIIAFSAIFVLLALSMFGLYDLKLPQAFQLKLAEITRSQAEGHYFSAFIMGALSTLILSPCVTAPLLGALSFIAKTGEVMTGGLALFFLGLGMGLPLLLIGMSAGRWLPKAGLWMNCVKNFFGVLLLGVAIYLLERLLPSNLTMLLWAALCIFSGVFMGAFETALTPFTKFTKAFGLMVFIYGILIVVGANSGASNPLFPLSGTTAKANDQGQILVKNTTELQALLGQTDKPVIVDFYASWCLSCKILETTVLHAKDLQSNLQSFQRVKIDITQNTEEVKTLMRKYGVIAPPVILFFNAKGEWLKDATLAGEIDKTVFKEKLLILLKNRK